MFLPNCSCCRPPGCRCDELPHTVTLSFSGFTDKAGGPGQEPPVFADATCFGVGARIVVSTTGPGPQDDPPPSGPISNPVIVDPGRCYAERDRVMPVLAAFGGGRGAVFEVVMEPAANDGCGRPRWRIASISVAGGSGYTNNSLLTITPSAGDVTLTAAEARVQTVGGVPQSVTIQNSGLYFRPITADRDFPIVTAKVGNAKLGVALEQLDGEPTRWKVSYVSVLLPGSGLSTGAPIVFEVGDLTTQITQAKATLVANDDGEAVAVTITDAGVYFRDTGLPPRVIQPTFTISGSPDAVVRGLVDDDPASEAFGQVVSLEIQNAGNVTGYKDFDIANDTLNGDTMVLRAANSQSLVTPCVSACHGSGALLETVGHVAPLLSAFLQGGVAFPGGGPVFFGVSVEAIPGSAPQLWKVSKLEFQTSADAPVPGQKIIITSPLPADVTTITPAEAELDNNLEPLITNPGAFFSQDRVWDGVPGPLTGIRLISGGSGYALRRRIAPSLSATAGSSATMVVELTQQQNSCGVDFWEIDEIRPSGNDVDDRYVVIIARNLLDTEEIQALAIVTTREEPTVIATVPADSSVNNPAELVVTLTKTEMLIPPRAALTPGTVATDVMPAYWSVTDIEIENQGSGYPEVSRILIEVTDGTETKPAAALAFANAAGEIVSVVVEAGGEYFLDNRFPQEVVIVRPGVYYREDSSLAPYVATPSVSLTQILPSNGSGAVIELEIEIDTASERFGQIVKATIPQGQGGGGYHMRSGARPDPFTGFVNYGRESLPITLTATRQGLSVASNFPVSSDTGLPVKTSFFFDMANKRAGDKCSEWFTNPLTPVTRTSSGSITATPGGAFTP